MIGIGGMGEVWRAWHLVRDRPVAIKRLAQATKRTLRERLAREARALAQLRHPAIVQLHDLGEDHDGTPFLVLELLEGEDLGDHVRRLGPMDPVRAVELLLPVADALALIHRRGLIHRDLKPDNVFLTRDAVTGPRAKLLDFGVARDLGVSGLTQGLLGTPEFMAPEQLVLGDRPGPAVDQWGFCLTLYEVTVGRRPFGGEDLDEVFERVRHAPLPYPLEARLDPKLFAILAQGTRKRPDERYPDITALVRALRAWLADRRTRDEDATETRRVPPPRGDRRGSPTTVDAAASPASESEPPLDSLDDAIRAAFES